MHNCYQIGILCGVNASHIERRSPTVAGETKLSNPLVGPTSNNGLPSGMVRGVIVKSRAPGLPRHRNAAIHLHLQRQRAWIQPPGVIAEQGSEALGIHTTANKCCIEATPTSSVLRLQAQVNRRRLRASSQEGISKLKQSIGSFGETRV